MPDWSAPVVSCFNRGVSDYRLSPSLNARLLGSLLVVSGVVMVIALLLVGLASLPGWLVPFAGVTCLVVLAVVGALVLLRGWAVRLGEDGYQVRHIRGAGVMQARWTDVEDAVAATVGGTACVVVRLKDGRSTTIPVAYLAVPREVFVRDLQEHLQQGQGLRRL